MATRIVHPMLLASIFLALASCMTTGGAQAQSTPNVPGGRDPTTCSPAPCVLPPTQASEGGAEVADAPIVANPLNPRQLLLGSSDFNCDYAVGAFTSRDGGSDWNRTCLAQGIGEDFPGGDPMVGYNRKGVGYIAGIYSHRGYNNAGFVGIQGSRDGVNWSEPVAALNLGNFPIDPWLTVDVSDTSPYVDSLYVSAVIASGGSNQFNRVYVSHSNDGGATWRPVAVAAEQTYPDSDNYTNVTTGGDGTAYLTWMYCNTGPYNCDNHLGYMVFSKSSDGGNTWSTPTLITTVKLLSTPLPNTNVGVTNIPVIGVDNSDGQNAGNLYVVMYNWTGTFMQVQVVRSTDGGNTWSKPVPVAPASDTHDQFFPWLSVSRTGLVGVSWLDRRNDPANIDYQAFAAISTDGGKSFQPNVQLTQNFSNPNNNGYGGHGWMGDYTGNTWAGPDFVAAWMDSSNGVDMQDVVGGIRLK